MATFYRAKHILLAEEDDTEYILEQLEAGESFESLAKEFSECESGEKGGDLGRFASGAMAAEFEKAIYHMQPGEIKSRVKTKYGFHIILRLE